MSSHREAPEISQDPVADNTDTYAFVSPDDPGTVTIIANYLPLEAPFGGPNFFEFGPDVRYRINIDNDGDGDADIVYEFAFQTQVANPNSFLYNTGPIDSIDSPNWNRKQFYSVTRISRDRHQVLAANLACPPCNVGVASTPNYSMVTPDTCADGHDWPKCQNGTPGRLPKVNAFLKTWIPKITASPAYRANGLIVIVFDESGSDENAGACCGEVDSLGYSDPSHPNLNEPGLYGPGGGRTGAVLLSKYIKPGTVSNKPYNHYSQLRSIEDIFGLKHIGDAQMKQVKSFGSDIYTRPKG